MKDLWCPFQMRTLTGELGCFIKEASGYIAP